LWEQFGQVARGVVICKQNGSKKNCIIVQYVLGVEIRIQTNDIGGQDQMIHHGGSNIQ
jgi:hypothetical protein